LGTEILRQRGDTHLDSDTDEMPVERRQLVGDLPGEGDDVRLWQGKVVETNRATGDDLDVGQRLLDGLAHGPHRPGVKDVLGRRVADETPRSAPCGPSEGRRGGRGRDPEADVYPLMLRLDILAR
jgi:hypothetical protein